MNTKAKGSRNERRSMQIFEKAGYKCTKSGASLGAWDIICVGSQDIVLCQVKSNQYPGTLEMAELADFKAPPNCRKIVHRWRDHQRYPDVREI